ncbi:MAG TPA: MBOAT family O-acyltransferase [Gemmataceae bacterium]|nr:MBOAT family O-acyltransferase [Gemmataceae bacterium]
MTFTETPFWILTCIVFGLWLVFRRNYRISIGLLLASSVVFYGYHQPALLLLIFAYCVVNWGVALLTERSRRPRLMLGLGVAFNLLLLGYWKYTPMLLVTWARLALALDLPTSPAPAGDWAIPFGISFYAFTGIAYMVDVFRRVTPAEGNFFRYTLSAMFFPHLVAGPILRPSDFLEKLRPETIPEGPEAPLEALHLLARGFFRKLVLADRLALAIDPFFQHVSDSSTAGAWALPFVYLYALQIYFDFAGYTDIARGLGLLFGYRWPDNFNLPYLATSVQDFWRRWHMTLSLFLRDYLYLPLGGNRQGRWRVCVNLMLTMLLGGLWHGASWSFMLWGGLHGGYLVIHRLWSSLPFRERLQARTGIASVLWRLACMILTFHSVCLAWCFFRLTRLSESLACVRKWYSFDADKLFVGGSADVSLWLMLGLYACMVLAGRVIVRRLPSLGSAQAVHTPLARGFQWGFCAALLVLAVLLSPGGDKPPFIYFQF